MMKHAKEKNKKIRRSEPFKNYRKITINDEVWYWYDAGSWHGLSIGAPDGTKCHVKYNQLWPGYSWNDLCYYHVMPADARRAIEEFILEEEIEFVVDPKAESGKLYAYREVSLSQGPSITIQNVIGGSGAWAQVHDHIKDKKPIMLVKSWADKKERVAYYKVLVGAALATVGIKYPRTWSGSFKETSLEWQLEKEEILGRQ